MHQMEEIKFSLKKSSIYFLIEAGSIFIAFWILVMLFLFSKEISVQYTEYDETYENSQVYHIADNLYDENEYSTFRKSKGDVSSVSEFYDLLMEDNQLIFASMFDQQIPVRGFKGDDRFDYGYQTDIGVIGKYTNEEGEFQNVKCMQMNRKTYLQYNLHKKSEANLFDEKINYNTGYLPIVLGNDYQEFYDIGDRLTVKYYFLPFEFEIVGFLPDNTEIFYNGNIHTSLDNYIVVPYPNHIDEINDFEFRGIISLAMLNGDIIVKEKGEALSYVLEKLEVFKQETGFDHYDVWGVPQYIIQYQQLYKIIENNVLNVKQLFWIVALVSVLLLSFSWYMIYRSRREVYDTYYLIGFDRYKICKLILVDLVPIPVASVILFILFFPQIAFTGLRCSIAIAGSLILLYVILYFLSIRNFIQFLYGTGKEGA